MKIGEQGKGGNHLYVFELCQDFVNSELLINLIYYNQASVGSSGFRSFTDLVSEKVLV